MTNATFMNVRKTILSLLLLFSAGYLMAQPLTLSTSATQLTCNSSNGEISVTPSGGLAPYTYEWTINNGPVFSTSASVNNLSAGLYWVKVTDANNDFQMDSVSIGNGMIAYFSDNRPAVCPQNNGSATISVIGGIAPLTYAWSSGATGYTANNLAGNSTVQVEVADANGCKAYFYNYNGASTTVGEITIGATSVITATYTTTPEQCPLHNGTITLTPTGGTAPYTYSWNTAPVQTTQTATNLTADYYSAQVTDAIGCMATIWTRVKMDADSLTITANKTYDQCSKQQGAVTIAIAGGTAPYTIAWEDGSTGLTRTNLGFGNYTVNVTDQNNCITERVIFIGNDSQLSTFITATKTACDNISGSAQVNVSGGTAPYTYQWSNGATTASISNLSRNYYSVFIEDASGCQAHAWTSVEIDTNCYAHISGKIFQDNNGNCVQDIGEYPILNGDLYMNAAATSSLYYSSYGYTGNTGNYSMYYILPDHYTLNFYDQVRTAACPSGAQYDLSIPASGVDYPNKDFAMVPPSLYEDVEILYGYVYAPPRPGFNYSYGFAYKNIGTLPSDGYIEVVYGNLETFVSSYPAPDMHDPATRTLRFNYSTLMLGEIRNVELTYHLPPTTALGSTYSHSVTADIGAADPTPLNNVWLFDFTVVGSFDPNDMAVYPNGNLSESDSVLAYTIRFQNTGTYLAELIVVKDTLEEGLDIATIGNISSSHPFRFRTLENRAVEFAFPNINLADSTSNEEGSHGFISYTIKRKKNLSPGTFIHNKAEIYFDFNAPIVTNTTANRIAQTTGVSEKNSATTGKIYPNPAKDFTEFSFEKEIASVQLMNASGIVVTAQKINNQKEFRMDLSLSKGMYFYTAYSADGSAYSGKLIVE